MAAPSGTLQGTQIAVYYDDAASAVDITSDSAVQALAVAANTVRQVTDMGAVESNVNVIEYSIFGQNYTNKLAGSVSYGDFTMDVAYDASLTDDASGVAHTALRDADDRTLKTIIITGTDPDDNSDIEYTALQGYVVGSSLTRTIDGISTLSITMALAEPPQFSVSS